MDARIASFVARRWQVPPGAVRLQVEPIHGGLESAVARVCVTAPHRGLPPSRFVVKTLRGGAEREADVYTWLWRHLGAPPTVQVLGRDTAPDSTYLFLEEAESLSPWPWAEIAHAAAVCRALARLHDSTITGAEAFAWNYEDDLAASADATLRLADSARDPAGQRIFTRIGDLRRVVGSLPALRARLLARDTAILHGDVHPGNVRVGEDGRVVLIDWGRARVGSPLEDVASWLHSLGCWEPRARQRHDTLMRSYLEHRHPRRAFGPELREDYWFASASNGLSGAIRYHVAVLADAGRSGAHADSRLALHAWQRVIRRTAALLSTSRRRCM